MIDISKLTECEIGKWVVYTAGDGHEERGKLKSWNDHYIFVVYSVGDEPDWETDKWMDYTAASTKPEDLVFDFPVFRSDMKDAYEFDCCACGHNQMAKPSIMMLSFGYNSGSGSCLGCGLHLHLEIHGNKMTSRLWTDWADSVRDAEGREGTKAE